MIYGIRCLKTDSWNHFFLDQVSHTCENICTFLQRSSQQHFADRQGLKLQDPDPKVGWLIICVLFSGGSIIIKLEPLVQYLLQSNLDYQTYPINKQKAPKNKVCTLVFFLKYSYKDEDPGKHWNLPLKWGNVPPFQRSIKGLISHVPFQTFCSPSWALQCLYCHFSFFLHQLMFSLLQLLSWYLPIWIMGVWQYWELFIVSFFTSVIAHRSWSTSWPSLRRLWPRSLQAWPCPRNGAQGWSTLWLQTWICKTAFFVYLL